MIKKFIFLLLKTCKCIPDALYFIDIFLKNGNNMKHTVNQTIYLAAWHAISNSIYYYYRLYIHTCIIQIEVDVFLYFKPFSPFSSFIFLGEYKHASLLIFEVFQMYANIYTFNAEKTLIIQILFIHSSLKDAKEILYFN